MPNKDENQVQNVAPTNGTAPAGFAPNADNSQQQQQQPQQQQQQAAAQQPKQQERTFTQSEVSAMMAKEKGQGRNSVYNELGIDPNDTATIALVKQIAAANVTGASVATATNDVEQRLLAMEQRALLAEMKTEALAQGAGAQYVDDVVTLVMAKLDADQNADFKTVLGEIRAKYPTLFGSVQTGSPTETGLHGTGSSVSATQNNGGQTDTKTGAGLGQRLAAQRRSSASKSSFFVD